MSGTVLVTGSAGFIGFHAARRFLRSGRKVVGLDAMTDYYGRALKKARHAQLGELPNFTAVEARLEEDGLVADLMADHRPCAVVHLAAQAGVRHSINEPRSYVDSNVIGTHQLLEAARAHPPAHLMLASTSSVYGANAAMPYAETHKADTPMSFYAATKKATEAMAHSYSHLFGIPVTMLRFFTVYGPWGRPDMALYKFVRAIKAGEPIDVYNHGKMQRDFTYVDDLVEGILKLEHAVPGTEPVGEMDSLSESAPFRVVNLGNSQPTPLMDFVRAVEKALGKRAEINFMDIQPGEVPKTWADASLLAELVGPLPRTPLNEGVKRFVDWHREFQG